MGTDKVDIGLWESSHTNLVVGSAEESRKGTGEGHSTIPCSTSHCHSNHILLSYEALDKLVGIYILEGKNLNCLDDMSKAFFTLLNTTKFIFKIIFYKTKFYRLWRQTLVSLKIDDALSLLLQKIT